MSRAATSQPSLAFPARKKADRSASSKQQQQQRAGKAKPTAAKKSPSTPSTAPPSTTASQRSEDIRDVPARDVSSSSRSSPRSAPIVRTASNERHIKDIRASVLPGTWTDASDNELLLRRFDLDYTYGPCGGLSRRERWQRAKQLGLDPPQSVLDILSQLGDDAEAEGGGVFYDDDVSTERVPEDAGRKRKRRKYDVDTHSIFENVTARILEAEGRVPP